MKKIIIPSKYIFQFGFISSVLNEGTSNRMKIALLKIL